MNFNVLSHVYNVGGLSMGSVATGIGNVNVLIVCFVVKYVFLRVSVVILSKC